MQREKSSVHGFSLRLLTLVVVCSTAGLGVCLGWGQKNTPVAPPSGGTGVHTTTSQPTSNTTSANYGGYGVTPESEQDLWRENSFHRARETERQKRMVDDANRLVVLAARYRAGVSEHGSPTAEDARLLQDMEKLARSVKDRMRGQ